MITRITAIVRTPIGEVNAVPYTSSGTSFSQYAIIQTGEYLFEVTRRTE
ncbi:hypothetical protein [Paucisalibacillus globulus]|nr:hypothetical protein [Paucisalibacillus globulus]